MARQAPKKKSCPRPLLSNTRLDQMIEEVIVDAYGGVRADSCVLHDAR